MDSEPLGSPKQSLGMSTIKNGANMFPQCPAANTTIKNAFKDISKYNFD